jgi:hypothetical protein
MMEKVLKGFTEVSDIKPLSRTGMLESFDLPTLLVCMLLQTSDTRWPCVLCGQFSSRLKENARFLRALEQGYSDFQAGLEHGNCISLETLPSLHKLSDSLAAYTSYLHCLLPYQCLRYGKVILAELSHCILIWLVAVILQVW